MYLKKAKIKMKKKSIINLISIFIIIISIYNNTFAQKVNRWESVQIPNGFSDPSGNVPDFYLDVYFLPQNPNLGWICGFNSKVLFTTDAGNTWEGRIINRGLYQLETIQFLNENVGYASGPNQNRDSDNGGIFKSTDGGNTWKDISPQLPVSLLWGFQFIDENYGIVAGGNCTTQIFYLTTDGGVNWNASSYKTNGGKISDPHIFEVGGKVWAIGAGTLWESLDGGKNWYIKSRTGAQDWHEELAIFGNSALIPFSEGCEGTYDASAGMRFSVNNGQNWSNYTKVKGPMFGSFLINETTGWAAGFKKGVYYTCDAGKSWNVIDCGLFGDLDDIYFVNDTTGWVVGNGIFRTQTAFTNSKYITKDTVNFCEGETITVRVDSIYNNHRWFTCSNSNTNQTSGEELISYSFNNPCDTGIIITYPVKVNPKPNYSLTISQSNPKGICEGDTVILSVDKDYDIYLWSNGETTKSIFVTKTGNYTVKVTNEFDCSTIAVYDVVFNPNPIAEILKPRRSTVCIGEKINLNSKNTHSKYSWYKVENGNIVGGVINTTNLYEADETGDYILIAENEFGCTAISKPVSLVFKLDSNRLDIQIDRNTKITFDKTKLNNIICDELVVKNKSSNDFVLDSVYFSNKLNFSMPLSQLPYILKPQETVIFEVCFNSRIAGNYFDTLMIVDVCNNKFVVLESTVEGLQLNGLTRCKLPWSMDVVEIGESYNLFVSPIYPNPTTNTVHIETLEFVPNKSKSNLLNSTENTYDKNNENNYSQKIEIMLYNNFGEQINNELLGINIRTLNITNEESGVLVNSKIYIENLNNLQNGNYLLIIKDFNGNTTVNKLNIIN